MPHYKEKNDQSAFKIPFAAISNGKLPNIRKRKIASNYQESSFLTETQKEAYHQWNINQAIQSLSKIAPENSK